MTQTSAADRAYDAVRTAIMRGDHPPGTMLSENDLAAGLGMSRTPVRAALVRLRDEGWLTIYPRRGALVRELSEQEVREAAEVRHALESAGVRLSTAATRERVVPTLTQNLQEQQDALGADDFPRFVTLALRFHRGFVEMSGNDVMLETYDRLQDRQYLSIVRSAGRIHGDPGQVVSGHAQLLDDALEDDGSAFSAHLAEHQAQHHDVESGIPLR